MRLLEAKRARVVPAAHGVTAVETKKPPAMFRFGCSVQATLFRPLERARRLPGGPGFSVFFYFSGPPLYVRDTLVSRLSGVTNLHVGDTLCRGQILRPTLRRLPIEGSLPVPLPRRQHHQVDDGQPISKTQGKLADDWLIYWKVLSLVADSHRQAKNPLRLHPIVMHPLPMTPFAYLPRTDCDMQSRNPHWSPDSPGASPTRQSQQMAGAMVTGGQASWEPLEHPPTDTSTPARIPASPAQAPLAPCSDVTHLRAKRAVKKSKERIGSTSARQPTALFPFLPPAARRSCRLPCTFVAAFFLHFSCRGPLLLRTIRLQAFASASAIEMAAVAAYPTATCISCASIIDAGGENCHTRGVCLALSPGMDIPALVRLSSARRTAKSLMRAVRPHGRVVASHWATRCLLCRRRIDGCGFRGCGWSVRRSDGRMCSRAGLRCARSSTCRVP